MEKRTVLVTLPVTEEQKEYLEETAGERAAFLWKSAAAVRDGELEQADAIIGNVPPERLTICRRLTWLQLSSAGADAYTGAGVLPAGTELTNASGAYGPAVSEHMLALTFAVIRRFGQYGRNQVRHVWKAMGDVISVEHSVTAVLGLGDIGGAYARKMKALGAYTIGVRRTEREKPEWLDEQYTLDALDKVLPRADIVAMALPGSPETFHLMDERRLGLMRKGSCLINVGRGNAVDTAALREALAAGRLAGAGLDVTDPEPLPADDPLWDFDNVVLTPHAAGWFFLPETLTRVVRISAGNLSAWLDGRPLTHRVSRTFGY